MDDEIDRLVKRLERAARKATEATKQRDKLIGELYRAWAWMRSRGMRDWRTLPCARR